MGRKKEPEKAANHERWLVSYADFITLLFAFFVVMFASANKDDEKTARMEQAMRMAFPHFGMPGFSGRPGSSGPGSGRSIEITIAPNTDSAITPVVEPGGSGDTDVEPEDNEDFISGSPIEMPDEFLPDKGGEEPEPTPTPVSRAEPTVQELYAAPTGAGTEGSPEMRDLFDDLEKALQTEIDENKIEMRQEKRGIVISLSEAGFFDSGFADLKPNSLLTLDSIAAKLASVRQGGVAMRIEGHTDDTPLSAGGKYRDNLELSTARANSVIYRLISRHKFHPRNLIASGYGEWRPVASNDAPEGRARNRRVDIVILTNEFAGLEAGGDGQ